MNLTGNTVLVTGGATGIGRAIAERFLQAGSTVVICGRRADKLAEVQAAFPQVHTIVADVAEARERVALVERVTREFPDLNVIVNNAGIQRRFRMTEAADDWAGHHQELAINLEAPIHLSMLFLAHLQKQAKPVIINVTSGLSFAPMPIAPVYCATKAALHSFTLSLRVQAEPLGITVIEVIPPAVQTDLGGAGLHTFGAPLDAFTDAVMAGLEAGQLEIGYGTSEQARKASREELDAALARLSQIPLGHS